MTSPGGARRSANPESDGNDSRLDLAYKIQDRGGSRPTARSEAEAGRSKNGPSIPKAANLVAINVNPGSPWNSSPPDALLIVDTMRSSP